MIDPKENAAQNEKAAQKENPSQYLKGRGAQFNPKNRFLRNERVKEHIEAIDDWVEPNVATQYLEEHAK